MSDDSKTIDTTYYILYMTGGNVYYAGNSYRFASAPSHATRFSTEQAARDCIGTIKTKAKLIWGIVKVDSSIKYTPLLDELADRVKQME